MFYLCGFGGTRSHTYFAADFIKETLTYLFVDFPPLVRTRILENVMVDRPLAADVLIADSCLRAWKVIMCRLRGETIDYVSETYLVRKIVPYCGSSDGNYVLLRKMRILTFPT